MIGGLRKTAVLLAIKMQNPLCAMINSGFRNVWVSRTVGPFCFKNLTDFLQLWPQQNFAHPALAGVGERLDGVGEFVVAVDERGYVNGVALQQV